jgi:hypothetical protein
MRAKEFINEAWAGKGHGNPKKVRDRASDALPGVYAQRQLRNTDTYMQYRMGLALAAARADDNGDIEFSQESAWAENFITAMYTDADKETIMLASKLMGVTPTEITDSKSREPKTTQAVSPVAKPKRNKYGV